MIRFILERRCSSSAVTWKNAHVLYYIILSQWSHRFSNALSTVQTSFLTLREMRAIKFLLRSLNAIFRATLWEKHYQSSGRLSKLATVITAIERADISAHCVCFQSPCHESLNELASSLTSGLPKELCYHLTNIKYLLCSKNRAWHQYCKDK